MTKCGGNFVPLSNILLQQYHGKIKYIICQMSMVKYSLSDNGSYISINNSKCLAG